MGRKRRAARRAAPAAHGAARGLRGGVARSGDCTRAGSARSSPPRPVGTAPPRTAPWGHPARPRGAVRGGAGHPAVGCLGVPLLPPRCGLHAGSGREGRGGMLCVSLPPFGYRFSSTHRRCGVSRCLLGAAVSGLGCGRFGCGRTCATLMISLQALRIPTAMCPRAWHKAGVSQEGEFGGKWDLTLG